MVPEEITDYARITVIGFLMIVPMTLLVWSVYMLEVMIE